MFITKPSEMLYTSAGYFMGPRVVKLLRVELRAGHETGAAGVLRGDLLEAAPDTANEIGSGPLKSTQALLGVLSSGGLVLIQPVHSQLFEALLKMKSRFAASYPHPLGLAPDLHREPAGPPTRASRSGPRQCFLEIDFMRSLRFLSTSSLRNIYGT